MRAPPPYAGSPNRECERVEGAARCAQREDAGLRLFASEAACCAASYGAAGCVSYPDRCYVRRGGGGGGGVEGSSGGGGSGGGGGGEGGSGSAAAAAVALTAATTPDRECVELAGAEACARAISGGAGAATRAECCAGFPGGRCVTYPTTCFEPDDAARTFPDKVCGRREREGGSGEGVRGGFQKHLFGSVQKDREIQGWGPAATTSLHLSLTRRARTHHSPPLCHTQNNDANAL